MSVRGSRGTSPIANVPPPARSIAAIVAEQGREWPTTLSDRIDAMRAVLTELAGPEYIQVKDALELLLRRSTSTMAPSDAESRAAIALKNYFEGQEQRSIQKWRVIEATLASEKKSIAAESLESMRDFFQDQAKNGMLEAGDVLVLNYLLYGDESQKKFLAGTMLRHQGQERVRAHNFNVGLALDASFMEQYGDKVAKLELPLFPAKREFTTLNQKVLACVDSTGGAYNAIGGDRVFRSSEGAGFLPVLTNSNGESAVDVTQVENAYNQLLAEQHRIQARITALSRHLPSGPKRYDSQRPKTCFNCGRPGHISRDCRSKPKTKGGETNGAGQSETNEQKRNF